MTTIADQIVVIGGGIVERRRKPLELYERPANLVPGSSARQQ